MRTDITKKTYYIKKSTIKEIERLSEGSNMTKVVNELLEYALYCVNLTKAEYLEDIEKIFRGGLDVYIKNRRNNS